jgi:release factor glutamine methyltransferase
MTTSRTSSPVPPAAPAAVVAALRAAGCVFAEEEAALLAAAAGTQERLASLVARRSAGEPLEHVVGWAWFRGLRIDVAPGVFVPRRRTEFLVRRALALAPAARVVVDLCCGTGALGAALAAALPGAEIHAADIDPAAVACAGNNLAPYGGRVHHGDLFAALPAGLRGRIEILAANVPYVPTADIRLLPAEAREHEPSVALDGGPDGLAVLRRVAADAPGWLAPGGCLLAETSGRQAAAARRAFADAGLTAGVAVCEESEAHVITGVLRPAGPVR